ncbi:MAG: penicillin-insensitive murein endopeptidase [Rhodobacteraceae bacterium]|jgi:penicillin-insensitive murein endopeptidase|nr:penicillin-insensitive murein endopeptidase [Paracoccaceae bacterium]
MTLFRALCVAAAMLAALPAPAQTAKELFGREMRPGGGSPEPLGTYARGCLDGAVELPETGPTWQAMRLSRNRNWGHPDTIAFLQRLSQAAAAQPGWNGLYVGDISQPRGGPMLTGHASHQIGLDADIWLRPADRLDLSRSAREEIGSPSLARTRGAYTTDGWTPQHHAIIRAAAQDPDVARIFIFPGAKVAMCDTETGDRAWLRKVRPWWGHDSHFHVRLRCPPGAGICEDQDPPPPGDGCDDARDWVADILNPPPADPNAPPAQPRREIQLADLPQRCTAVLQR